MKKILFFWALFFALFFGIVGFSFVVNLNADILIVVLMALYFIFQAISLRNAYKY
jgi:hypothetical protein